MRQTKLPLVADGVIWRVLSKLLNLNGERLSYRTLDVSEIGSVYETMMGFRLELTQGPSIALKPASAKKLAAPIVVNLAEWLTVKPGERDKWLKERHDQKFDGAAGGSIKKAASLDDLLAALDKRIARSATPHLVPTGAMVLQPSDERRRSGSHYTPRALTAPIVERTLAPVLARLGGNPTPGQILDLKVCDPAVGSGAFLVEACRQLGDVLVKAWHAHAETPFIPADEDEVLHARRLVAQRCLYGVDRNPMAADLAKLSLWLATLAKDHPFTFIDHSIRTGDSLVGLSRRQIEAFHWRSGVNRHFDHQVIEDRLRGATAKRREIMDAGDDLPPEEKADRLRLADEALYPVRLAGDAVIAAFFAADKGKAREAQRDALLAAYNETMATGLPNEVDEAVEALRGEVSSLPLYQRGIEGDFPNLPLYQRGIEGDFPSTRGTSTNPPLPPFFKGGDEKSIHPFHWEIEFPEVFQRENPGFDAFVGNPPFAGKNTLINGNRAGYLDWLKILHEQSHGNADLVAHFFRRAFDLLRPDGAFGLIATNTIGQGDTRSTGLRWICTHGGMIYWARKRYRWPGAAAVVVSVVHVHKSLLILKSPPTPLFQRGEIKDSSNPLLAKADLLNPPLAKGGRGDLTIELDGRPVEKITAYLFHAGDHDDPKPLKANTGKSFIGSYVLGMGFTFDDTDSKGVASPLAEMYRLIEHNPKNAERIFPYIGGEEVNDSPTHAHHRYVINFADFPLRREAFPLAANIKGSSFRHGLPESSHREVNLRVDTVPNLGNLPLVPKLPLGNGDSEAPASSAGTRSRSFEDMGSQAGAWEPAFLTWADADDKQREAWLRTGIVPLDYPGPVAADWSELLEIVERRVKPQRDQDNRDIRKRFWWRFGENTPALFEAIRGLERVLVNSQVSTHLVFAFLPASFVYAHYINVFPPTNLYSQFAIQQSRLHEVWTRFFASSLGDGLRYTPSDCFETFPFPPAASTVIPAGMPESSVHGWQSMKLTLPQLNPDTTDPSPSLALDSGIHDRNDEYLVRLESAGKTYYDYRAELMVKNHEGLTKTYNRFHDPNETAPEILKLRELHTAMDRAVLDAYGWADIPTDCVFLLDWEDEDEENALSPSPSPASGRGERKPLSPTGRGVGERGKKKPWRYRWPDEVRDEVLARLLALNAERAAEEERAGQLAIAATPKPAKPVRKGGKSKPDNPNMEFDF